MAKEISRLIARGKHKGKDTVLECVEFENKKDTSILVFKDGKSEKEDRMAKLARYVLDARIIEMVLQSYEQPYIAHLPTHGLNYIWSYWVALHETYFDTRPTVEIKGSFEPFGLPYSNTDTSGVVF